MAPTLGRAYRPLRGGAGGGVGGGGAGGDGGGGGGGGELAMQFGCPPHPPQSAGDIEVDDPLHVKLTEQHPSRT